jgi:prepilin-type N-terminal cleavage/methylation domain-containing protein
MSKRKFARSENPARKRGLTLAEMMVTMGVFSLVVMGLLYEQIFGLKQDELVESKLGASDMARRDFEQLANDIRGSQMHYVGNYSGGNFTHYGNNTNQQGNALQVFLNANNTNAYILYYFDTNSTPGTNMLCRWHTGDAASTVIASYLTNFNGSTPLQFIGEDYNGVQQQNPNSYKDVIHFTLGFLQYQYPLTKVGNSSNYLYDFYKMEFRLAPHVPSGR